MSGLLIFEKIPFGIWDHIIIWQVVLDYGTMLQFWDAGLYHSMAENYQECFGTEAILGIWGQNINKY